jgi:hypothetical protein
MPAAHDTARGHVGVLRAGVPVPTAGGGGVSGEPLCGRPGASRRSSLVPCCAVQLSTARMGGGKPYRVSKPPCTLLGVVSTPLIILRSGSPTRMAGSSVLRLLGAPRLGPAVLLDATINRNAAPLSHSLWGGSG